MIANVSVQVYNTFGDYTECGIVRDQCQPNCEESSYSFHCGLVGSKVLVIQEHAPNPFTNKRFLRVQEVEVFGTQLNDNLGMCHIIVYKLHLTYIKVILYWKFDAHAKFASQ